MKLIAGLGNPGPEYVFSRHNAGWLLLDHLCIRYSCGTPACKFSFHGVVGFREGESFFSSNPSRT